MKNQAIFNVSQDFLKEMSLHDVRLDPNSLHWRAQQTNLEFLLMLDVDNLVWSFRKTAGLPTPGKPYGGWEDQKGELRGHFVGHFMSATARMWASTHNDTVKERMSAAVSALSACQQKIGTGYLSAFPTELFDRVEAIKPVWAPYYTIHKILAGLLDQYTLADNVQALKMVTWMVDYFYNRVQNVVSRYSLERHYLSLNTESGGMNDVLYRLYSITKDPKHLLLAYLFDKPCFLGVLAIQADDISGFHANTHIPIVVGSQMRYEVTGDPLHKAIGTFFLDIVNSSHTYATGGTSDSEFWTNPRQLAETLNTENEESCTTYNMLKVARHLFTWTKEVAYADYYERALTNGVLSIQRGTNPGVMIYMLPLGAGVSKSKSYHGWGTPFDTFWCCYGTATESFSKLGDTIYFEEINKGPVLYIIQYISSSLNWISGQFMLNQKVDPVVSTDPHLRVTFTFSSKKGAGQSTLNLRIPIWTFGNGAKASINAESLTVPAPGTYLSVTRNWGPADKLTLDLPFSLRTEAINDGRPTYASLQAILYGPYLLAGHTMGDRDMKTGSAKLISGWITPIPAASYNAYLATFSQVSRNSTFVLTNSNQAIAMDHLPLPGSSTTVNATFRLILNGSPPQNFSTLKDAIGKSVMLEPYNFPGMVVVVQKGLVLAVAAPPPPAAAGSSAFQLVAGLDGRPETVSLESESNKGCFVYGGVNNNSSTIMNLKCQSGSKDANFNQAASFVMGQGLSEYHPISFVAKGARRNFLLQPLLSFQDEFYSVYFNIQA
uniref:Alpha-L-arabinofuranosidase B arabinose-binding domain-containing protein n=1 Tax=Fagus sylvatica TaxID=28930 RepID=A0A2N9J4V2_FAGSY